MKFLVFDTCFNKSYIVLREDDKVLADKAIESTDENYHSAYLIPSIRDILKENQIQIKDLDAIGVNIGPGSFTGIRAGITIARVFAQQAEIALVGISSLEILSKINNNFDHKTIVTLDARKNKAYYAEYVSGNEITHPCLIDKDELPNKIDKESFIITDTSLCNFLNEKEINSLNYEKSDNKIGMYLSDIVYSNLINSKNSNFNWANVKPLYIQKPSITIPKVKTNV